MTAIDAANVNPRFNLSLKGDRNNAHNSNLGTSITPANPLITHEQTAAAAKAVVKDADCIPDCVKLSPQAKEELNASQKAKQWIEKNVPVRPTNNGVKGLTFLFKF